MDQFYTSLPSNIELTLDVDVLSSDLSWLDGPARWQAVTRLKLRLWYYDHQVDQFLRYLTLPVLQQGRIIVWPFEAMNDLSIDGRGLDCGQELLEFTRTRWQTPPSIRSRGAYRPWARSGYRLHLRDSNPLKITQEQIREIQNILVDGDVRIEGR